MHVRDNRCWFTGVIPPHQGRAGERCCSKRGGGGYGAKRKGGSEQEGSKQRAECQAACRQAVLQHC